jgi:hypothetical protein
MAGELMVVFGAHVLLIQHHVTFIGVEVQKEKNIKQIPILWEN